MYGSGVMINVNLCKKYNKFWIKNVTHDAFKLYFPKMKFATVRNCGTSFEWFSSWTTTVNSCIQISCHSTKTKGGSPVTTGSDK